MTTTDLKGDIKWRERGLVPRDSYERDDDESMPDLVSCDRCKEDGLWQFFRSYDTDLDLCVSCYKVLREAATPAEKVAEAKVKWRAALLECVAAGVKRSKVEQKQRHETLVYIWNFSNPHTPCPFASNGPKFDDDTESEEKEASAKEEESNHEGQDEEAETHKDKRSKTD